MAKASEILGKKQLLKLLKVVCYTIRSHVI